MRYKVLQPMLFVVGGQPGDHEELAAGTFVDGVREDRLRKDDARSLQRQRKWHKGGRRNPLTVFLWQGQVRFGVVGLDLDPGR